MNRRAIPQVELNLEDELLGLMASQARRVLIPVFLVAVMIASFAADYVPRSEWIAWLAVVLAILVARATVIPMLTKVRSLTRRGRLYVIIGLGLAHGIAQGYSLTFFPKMGILEQSMQTMLLAGLCMGAVVTTGGHLPFFLAFIVPIIIPLAVVWLANLGGSGLTQVDLTVGFSIILFTGVLISVAYDTHRQFHRSFEDRKQLRAANDAKTRFLATASHDLRQPMQTLSASIESLRYQNLDEATRATVDELNTAKEDLSELLRALLDISRLDAGVEDLERYQFDLYRLLFAIWDEYASSAEEKGLDLVLDCPGDAHAITNPVQFKRVIGNLVSNAIRYTDSGGVRIACTRSGGKHVVEVSDTGIGIHPSEIDRIFEDFHQAIYPARSQKRAGLGLGLAIVRRLVEQLDLELEKESELNKGSKFRIKVPAAQPTESRGAAPVETSFDFAGLKVLVVDDEEHVANAMRRMLEGIKCKVYTATRMAKAIEIAERERPDVLLVDRRLDGSEDGLQLIFRLRETYPDIPAILISGDTAPDRINEAQEASIPALVKPAGLKEIKERIVAVCTAVNHRGTSEVCRLR
jgi:signal transduction histidine kinase/ActR/RegA family two-component response regulator